MNENYLKIQKIIYFFFGIVISSIFFFFGTYILNAETTYYDWEKVEVSELPNASDSTLDKVYIYGDKYYITQSETTGGALELNHNYKGDIIYCDFPVTFAEDMIELIKSGTTYVLNGTFSSDVDSNNHMYFTNTSTLGGNFEIRPTLRYKVNSTDLSSPPGYLKFTVSDGMTVNGWCNHIMMSDFIISEVIVDEFYNSLYTSPITTYSWIEVSKENVLPVIQNKIYVPTDNLSCYRFIDRYTLRGYFSKPNINDNASYYDFYLDQHYNSIEGTETITEEISCLSNTTTDYLYRHDIVHILVFFLIVSFFVIFIPIKLLFRLFRRFN